MKARIILSVALAALALTACEDYSEHHFGKAADLYQSTQVNAHTVALTAAHYADLAANAENQALAQAANDGGQTLADLQSVGQKGYFRGRVSPAEYLPALLKSLVGSSQYYAMTAGSTITVQCRVAADSAVSGKAYRPVTTLKAGKYLLAPKGETQVLANSNNAATGQTYTYGYIYLSGSTRCPEAVTRLSETAIKTDANAGKHLYEFVSAGDQWYILNPLGSYLTMNATNNTLQYVDEVEDESALWSVTANADGTWDITNVSTGKVLLYSTQYASAGGYADRKGTEGYVGIELYASGDYTAIIDGTPEQQDVVFTLGEDGVWTAKADYLNQSLLTLGSTDPEAIYTALGWSIEYNGTIGDLSYVWSATTQYGLKASAYKSGTKYPTDSWAISPALNLKKAKQPVFYFEEAQKYSGTPLEDYLQVWVCTDYNGRGSLAQSVPNWTNVTAQLQGTRPDGSSWDYSPMSLDLSAYAGQQQVYVAFRYISTDTYAATWEVKNVVCREKEE